MNEILIKGYDKEFGCTVDDAEFAYFGIDFEGDHYLIALEDEFEATDKNQVAFEYIHKGVREKVFLPKKAYKIISYNESKLETICVEVTEQKLIKKVMATLEYEYLKGCGDLEIEKRYPEDHSNESVISRQLRKSLHQKKLDY